MCVIKGIRLLVGIFSWFKLVFMLYAFSVGCYFTQSLDLQSAYGTEFISYGLSLIFLALLSLAMILPFKYGVNRHNRFILAFVFVMETIVFSEMINIGYTVLKYTIPEFPKALQEDCLKHSPNIYSKEECSAFYDADRTAGFRLFWASYYSRRSNKYDNQVLATIESGTCCGFFAPFHCETNTASFPKNRNPEFVTAELKAQRVTCSSHTGYYPQQSDCTDYIDFALGLVGGCNYDLATGACITHKVDEKTVGCASATEDYCNDIIKPHALLLIGLSMTNFFYMFVACVLWWKRKETDVFPVYVEEDNKIVSRFLFSSYLIFTVFIFSFSFCSLL
jgi:hypothetical protein